MATSPNHESRGAPRSPAQGEGRHAPHRHVAVQKARVNAETLRARVPRQAPRTRRRPGSERPEARDAEDVCEGRGRAPAASEARSQAGGAECRRCRHHTERTHAARRGGRGGRGSGVRGAGARPEVPLRVITCDEVRGRAPGAPKGSGLQGTVGGPGAATGSAERPCPAARRLRPPPSRAAWPVLAPLQPGLSILPSQGVPAPCRPPLRRPWSPSRVGSWCCRKPGPSPSPLTPPGPPCCLPPALGPARGGSRGTPRSGSSAAPPAGPARPAGGARCRSPGPAPRPVCRWPSSCAGAAPAGGRSPGRGRCSWTGETAGAGPPQSQAPAAPAQVRSPALPPSSTDHLQGAPVAPQTRASIWAPPAPPPSPRYLFPLSSPPEPSWLCAPNRGHSSVPGAEVSPNTSQRDRTKGPLAEGATAWRPWGRWGQGGVASCDLCVGALSTQGRPACGCSPGPQTCHIGGPTLQGQHNSLRSSFLLLGIPLHLAYCPPPKKTLIFKRLLSTTPIFWSLRVREGGTGSPGLPSAELRDTLPFQEVSWGLGVQERPWGAEVTTVGAGCETCLAAVSKEPLTMASQWLKVRGSWDGGPGGSMRGGVQGSTRGT